MSSYSSHTVSLSLGDLKPNHEVENDYNAGNHDALTYELQVLLQKAKGTPYEASLRRCLDHKLRVEQQPSLPVQSTLQSSTTSLMSAYRQQLQQQQLAKSTQLATPLERSTYKKPELRWNSPTNHLGRQRPPERNCSAEIDPSNYTASSIPITLPQPTPSYSPGASARPTVSLREFNKWLEEKKQWNNERLTKITRIGADLNAAEAAEMHSPRLYPKSISLAQLSRRKEWQQMQQTASTVTTDTSHRDTSSAHASTFSESASVFERLYRHRTTSATRHRSQTPPPLHTEFTFSPRLCPHSLELAKRRHRSLSATRRIVRTASATATSIPAWCPSGSSASHRRTRSKSHERSAIINRERLNPKRPANSNTTTTPSGERLFQPRVVAPESRRIMSRMTDTFEDRVVKSVETFTVRKVLAKDHRIPGPGHYNQVYSPAIIDQTHTVSPGKRGFTFGKQSRGVLFHEATDPL